MIDDAEDTGRPAPARPGDDAALPAHAPSRVSAPRASMPGCCGGAKAHAGHAHTHEAGEHDHAEAHAGDDHADHADNACGSCDSGPATALPVFVFTRAQARAVDQSAINDFGIPGIVLMENAARGVATILTDGLADTQSPTVVIFAGPGNNGGDGLAIARHLDNRGINVGVVLVAAPDALSPDAKTHLNIIRRMGLSIYDGSTNPAGALDECARDLGPADVVVDAILGTGADRAAQGAIKAGIECVNRLKDTGASIVAVDLPSGLDADAGTPLSDDANPGACVRADLTIALCGLKIGFLSSAARPFVGELVVVDIGAPAQLVASLGRPFSRVGASAGVSSGGGCGGGGCGCAGSPGAGQG